jgi:CHAP domain/Kelch motif
MKTNKFQSITLIGVLLFLVLALSLKTSLNIKVAEATAPNPSWWVDNNGSFSQYDTYQFNHGRTHMLTPYPGYGAGSNIISTNASYDGVAAIGPTGTTGGTIDTFFTSDASASDELEWQCVELVKRFLFTEYGTISQPANGYQVVDTYANAFPNMYKKVTNDSTNTTNQIYPKPGDILSYNQQPIPSTSPVQYDNGHTALVQSVTNKSGGSATVQLIEQNASGTGITNQTFSNWQFQNGIDDSASDGHTVSGWLTTTAAHLTWTNEGNLSSGQYGQQSALLPDGKVLIAGGYDATGGNVNTTRIYTDGSGGTGSWSNKAGMSKKRATFALQPVTVSGGATKVLAAGGASASCSCITNTSELYDESSNTWSSAASMNQNREIFASSLLSDGRVLVTGGSPDDTSKLSSTEIYDPVANTWTTKASLNTARFYHQQVTFTDSNGNSKVMVIGGMTSSTSFSTSTEIYDSSANTWTAGPSLSYGRNRFKAILLNDGRILVAGGESSTYTHSEVYNPSTNSWTTYTTPITVRYYPGAVALGSGAGYKVLLAGGSPATSTSLLFDPYANSWSTTTSMNNTARYLYTFVLLNNGNVIAGGGYDGSNPLSSSEEYTP